MSEQKIRVLIADDQRLMREGLRIILEDAPDIEVIGEAENGLIAIQIAENRQPDVILMDIRMPVLDGIEATERIRKLGTPGPRILLLTTFDTPELVVEGMHADATGYNTSLIFQYFDDKLGLYAAVLRRADRQMSGIQAQLLAALSENESTSNEHMFKTVLKTARRVG